MAFLLRWAAVGLVGVLGVGIGLEGRGLAADTPTSETPAPEPGTLEALVERLRRQYPDRESVTAHAQPIADQLLEFSRRSRVDPDGPPVAGRAAILAAEVLFQGGRTRTACDVLAEIARFGPRDEDRAKALYLLGEHYFFLERYAERDADGQPVSGTALYYWEILTERYPDAPWTHYAARPLRYARLVGSKDAPDFEATFQAADASVTYSRDDLSGKLVVLDFWRSSAPGQKDRESRLAGDLTRRFQAFPSLRKRVVVLGVNLDVERETYEIAREAWDLPWPQAHDGKGFQSPLAEAFAIPQVPHRVLIDPRGQLAYIGSDDASFRAALGAELDRLSSDAEPPAQAPDEAPSEDQEPGSGSAEEASSGSSDGR